MQGGLTNFRVTSATEVDSLSQSHLQIPSPSNEKFPSQKPKKLPSTQISQNNFEETIKPRYKLYLFWLLFFLGRQPTDLQAP